MSILATVPLGVALNLSLAFPAKAVAFDAFGTSALTANRPTPPRIEPSNPTKAIVYDANAADYSASLDLAGRHIAEPACFFQRMFA